LGKKNFIKFFWAKFPAQKIVAILISFSFELSKKVKFWAKINQNFEQND
jgi:hypothetical protein